MPRRELGMEGEWEDGGGLWFYMVGKKEDVAIEHWLMQGIIEREMHLCKLTCCIVRLGEQSFAT